jgi:hypothetical protein
MPALGGASAIPLRYLDYLIHEPIRSVMLFKGGVPVTVPAPERFAIHKLIAAAVRRADSGKSSKDIAQAEQIIQAMLPRRSFALREAWMEAWTRGTAWRANLDRGRGMLGKSVQDELNLLVATKSRRKLQGSKARHKDRKPIPRPKAKKRRL